MPQGRNSALVFGPFRLFPGERRLEKDGLPIRLGGRALDLLITLAEHAGEVMPNQILIDSVWRGVHVADTSLRFHIKTLRKALGDDRRTTRYLANVPGRGYCLVVPVEQDGPAVARHQDEGRLLERANLPSRASIVIGRADSIETVSRDLTERRLVTIAGAGGIGKTTLAIATADEVRDQFGGAVFFVDLAPIEDPALAAGALASVLGVVPRAADAAPAIVDFLRDKRLLIVLDNCEQVVEAVAGLADRILRGTDGIHLLVTSREPLRISGERVHRLLPLECPPTRDGITAEEAMTYPAIQLFVERAAARLADFALDDALAPAAAEICQRLDGIPLAIELAAARIEFFGIQALARGLNDMFTLLTQGRRLALPRHQTLRATLDWGYALLPSIEQAVLRRLTVFRGSFTLESAVAVVAHTHIRAETAIGAMANLVEKSLLTVDRAGETPHYRLLETTRLYGNEKLTEGRERLDMARRHAALQLQLIEAAQREWGAELGRGWLRRHAGRMDDIRAALDWSFSTDGDLGMGLDLITASAQLWFQLSLTLEYRARIERALGSLSKAIRPDAATELRLQLALGHALWYTASEPAETERAFTRALVLTEEIGAVPAPLQLQALWGAWASRRGGGRYRDALAIATRYDAIARRFGDPAFMLLGDRILGLTQHYLGDQQTARRLLERVRRVAHITGNPPNTDFQLDPEIAATALLPRILWLQGLPDQAEHMLQAAIERARRSDHWYSMYYVLCLAGCPLAFWTGDLERAQDYLAQMVSRSASDRWRRCWALILRLRQGGEPDRLIADFLEPRLDISTFSAFLELASAAAIPVPQPSDDAGDALWAAPEILRVNAELLLWHKAPDAAAKAEDLLRRALDLTRGQMALSWELRTAMSLGRLWHRNGRASEARHLLAATCDRFTEGVGTRDLIQARQVIADWS